MIPFTMFPEKNCVSIIFDNWIPFNQMNKYSKYRNELYKRKNKYTFEKWYFTENFVSNYPSNFDVIGFGLRDRDRWLNTYLYLIWKKWTLIFISHLLEIALCIWYM